MIEVRTSGACVFGRLADVSTETTSPLDDACILTEGPDIEKK